MLSCFLVVGSVGATNNSRTTKIEFYSFFISLQASRLYRRHLDK